MKITVIIYAILIAQVSASFFDAFQGAVLSVQNSFGKLLSDVVNDVKETVDCTLLAVEHVLALSEDATTRYYNKCGSGTNNNPASNDAKPTEKPIQKINITLEFVNDNKQEDIKNEAPSDIGAKINDTVVQLLGNYNAQDKLYSVGNVLAKETKQIVNVSDEIQNQLEKFSKVNLSVFNTTNPNLSKPSINTVLHELKILEKREQETKNASEASQIHKIIDGILAKLKVISATEVTENEKIEKILIDLERETNNSFSDLRKEFEEWKIEENLHLGEIKNNIEEREELANHTTFVKNKALLIDENTMVNNSSQNYSSISLTSAEISNESSIINVTNEKITSVTPLAVTTLTNLSAKLNTSDNIINNTITTIASNGNVTIVNSTLHLKSDNEAKYPEVSNTATILNDTNYNATDSVTHLEYKNIGYLSDSKYSIESIKDPPIEKLPKIISNQAKLLYNDTLDTFSNSDLTISENSTIPSVDYSFSYDTGRNVSELRTANELNISSSLHNSVNSLQPYELNKENPASRDISQLETHEQASNETTQFLADSYLQNNITMARSLNNTQTANFTSNFNGNKEFIKNSTDLTHKNISYSEISDKNKTTFNEFNIIADSKETLDSVNNMNIINNFTFNEYINKTFINDTLLSVLTISTTVPTLISTNTSPNLLTTVLENSQIINTDNISNWNVTSKDTLHTNNETNREYNTLKSISTQYLSLDNNMTVINAINNTNTRDYFFNITESERASRIASHETVNNLNDIINHTNTSNTSNVSEYPKNPLTITESESLILKTNFGSIEMNYQNVVTPRINTLEKNENTSIIISDNKFTSVTPTYLPVGNIVTEVIRPSNNSDISKIKVSLSSTLHLVNNTNDDQRIISSTDNSPSDIEIVNMPYRATSLPLDVSKTLTSDKTEVEPTTFSIILNATVTMPLNDTFQTKASDSYGAILNKQIAEKVNVPYDGKEVVNSINNVEYVAQISNNTVTNHKSNSGSQESVSSNMTTSNKSEISSNTNLSSIMSSQSNHRETILDNIINNAMLKPENQKDQKSKQMQAKSTLIINDVSTSEAVASSVTTEITIETTSVLNDSDPKPSKPDILPLSTGTIKELAVVARPRKQSLAARKSYPITNTDDNLPRLNRIPSKKLNQRNDFYTGSSSTELRQSAGNSFASANNNANLRTGGDIIKSSRENTFDRASNTLLGSGNPEKAIKNYQFPNRNSNNQSLTLLSKKMLNINQQPKLNSASNNFHNPPLRKNRGKFTTPKSALEDPLRNSQDNKQYQQHYQPPSELQAHQQAVREAQRLITNTREQNRVLSNIRRHKNRAKSVFKHSELLNAR